MCLKRVLSLFLSVILLFSCSFALVGEALEYNSISPDASAPLRLYGYQTCGSDIRLLYGVNSLEWSKYGMEITVNGQSTTVNHTTVYTSVQATLQGGQEETIEAQALGSNYIATLVLQNIPATGTYGITVKAFVWDAASQSVAGTSCIVTVENGAVKKVATATVLYNGIAVPNDWTDPAVVLTNEAKVKIPYLIDKSEGGYAPDVVNIDTGRQLFVDDFLIDNSMSSGLTTTYYQATVKDDPVFTGVNNQAFLTSGGVWYDMEAKLYKMWYQYSFTGPIFYAYSTDGDHWTASNGKTNDFKIKLDGDYCYSKIASSSVWLDYDAPANERYKMLLRQTNTAAGAEDAVGLLYVSADGMNWTSATDGDDNAVTTGPMHDRSTFFYDALNGEWRFSIRVNTTAGWGDYWVNGVEKDDPNTRVRYVHSGSTWLEASQWESWDSEPADNVPKLWLQADSNDGIDGYVSGLYAAIGSTEQKEAQLYNVDAIAYESVMIGLQQIWYGPGLSYTDDHNTPKITEIQASYSRDGFYYYRPEACQGFDSEGNSKALIQASRTVGDWDYGYLSTATGGIIVLDDEIRIYYSAVSGTTSEGVNDAYQTGTVGYATLRRDGFASLSGSGEVTTKLLTVTKAAKYLFVNADVSGSLKAEIIDADGNVLDGYSANDCTAFQGDSCCTKLSWNGADDLSFLQNSNFRIRFVMEDGDLYSFWLSPDENGTSGGEMAAGYAGGN